MLKLLMGLLSIIIIAWLMFKATFIFLFGLAILCVFAIISSAKDNIFEAISYALIILIILIVLF